MERRYKNPNGSLVKGLIIGILFPALGLGIGYIILSLFGEWQFGESAGYTGSFSWRTMALIGLLFNLIPFHYFINKGEYNTIRGIILPTIILGITWFLIYRGDILNF